MTNSIHLDKNYGVVHNKDYYSFFGFAKKIGNSETQKIDVYLDDKLIHTILANEFIEKIDDMYDIENQAFSYNLPFKYIDGVKHQISFKYHHSGEELLNSPYTLIDKNHEDFNEARFIHSLSEPLSEELKNMYKPNSIGFLATKENLEDEEFVEFLNEIIRDFPNADFKALYFNKKNGKEIKEKFQAKNLSLLQIKGIKDIFENLEVYLSNYEKTYQNLFENNIVKILRQNSNNILAIGLGLIFDKISLLEKEQKDYTYYKKFFDNLEYLGFKQKDIKRYGNSYHEIYFKKLSEEYNITLDFSMEESVKKAYVYWNLQLCLKNHKFLQFVINFIKKMIELNK